jgi:glycosyltransferase involved in cell wall biosynthesis
MNMDFDLLPADPVGPPPKVSVWMITYNHENCIAQALDSILQQTTTFPFEIVIGEDCSPDGTRELIREYQRRYPETIRLLLWRKNAGIMLNTVRTLEACSGEYIAFCEGDDYWTDPEKMQRQVDLLAQRPDLALCHHEVDYVTYDNGRRERLHSFPPEAERDTRSAVNLIAGNFIQTCSLMIRRTFLPVMDADFLALKLGDWPLCYLVAEHGDIGYIDRNMADYRIHVNNQWKQKSEDFRYFESARMAFYLAAHAQLDNSRAAWRETGRRIIDSLFGGHVRRWTAWRRFQVLRKEKWMSAPAEFGFLGRYAKRRFKTVLKRIVGR